MKVIISCIQCSTKLRVPAEGKGSIKCPKCEVRIVLTDGKPINAEINTLNSKISAINSQLIIINTKRVDLFKPSIAELQPLLHPTEMPVSIKEVSDKVQEAEHIISEIQSLERRFDSFDFKVLASENLLEKSVNELRNLIFLYNVEIDEDTPLF